jgi:hypothetical protein
MIYLAIDSADSSQYFKFTSIDSATAYIKKWNIKDFTLTDYPFFDENDKPYPDESYTVINA